MFKTSPWKKIFGHTEKKKVSVRVGDSLQKFTDTQIGRLTELKARWRPRHNAEPLNVLDQTRYTIEEAAFRLLISEEQLLQEAKSGKVRLCVDVRRLQGRWRQPSTNDRSMQSSAQTLQSGFLALTRKSCDELVQSGSCYVSVLEFHSVPDPSGAGLEPEIIAALSTWGRGTKYFCLQEPLWVDRDKIRLLPPLKFDDVT